jgi:hypothetical protein
MPLPLPLPLQLMVVRLAFASSQLFLRRASLSKDPIERFKWVMAFVVSGLHRGVKQVKPFNPILGETWQSEYKDGTRLYMEQLAHHPPITGFEVVGPNNLFYFHVSVEPPPVCTPSFARFTLSAAVLLCCVA